jgi:hypothetical protein
MSLRKDENESADEKETQSMDSLLTQQRRLRQPRKIHSGRVLLFMNVRQRVDVAAISDRTFSYGQVFFLNLSPVPCLHKTGLLLQLFSGSLRRFSGD